MIALDTRNRASAGDEARNIPVIGIGGAGANVLDRLALDGVAASSLIALNTDAQALTASVAGEKIQLGAAATRGLGSGGDPELGRCAAEESASEIRGAVEGSEAVILVAGLGGGTGSGAIPLAAETAHESGALVIAVVTLPFGFEGKRRSAQAAEALSELQRHADAVICFENDRMGETVPAASGIQTAFAAADQTLSQCIQAIGGILKGGSGLISLGLDDLASVLQDVNARCLFGHGQADGKNRSFDALARALKNPLMDKGRLLRDCDTVLVRVAGGPDLTLDEVQLLMEEFNRYINDHTRILFGVVVEPGLAGKVNVSILSSVAAVRAVAARPVRVAPAKEPAPKPAPVPAPVAAQPTPAPVPMQKEEPTEEEEAVETEAPEEAADPDFELEPTRADEAGLPVVETGEEAQEQPAPKPSPETTPEPSSEAQPDARKRLKPRGLRAPTFQGSLFGEEAAAAAPVERIAPPVPGRMLRNPFPQPEPQPEPTPEPQRETATAPAPVSHPSSLQPPPFPPETDEPEPAPEIEPQTESPFEPLDESEPEPAAEIEEPAAPEPEPAPAVRQHSFPRRMPHRAVTPEPPELIPTEPAQPGSAAKPPLQEVMEFEPVTRGRFEKSEPTIVDGQDLDVPTYMRRRMKLR